MFKMKTITLAVCAALGVAGCSALQSFRQPAAPQTSVSPSQAAYLVGRKHQGAQRYDEATAAFRQALAAEPNHVDAHNALGAVHATQGRYVEAIAEFEAAKALAPRLAYVQGNLGYAYLLRGDNDRAVQVLEEAKRLDPSDGAVLRNLWTAYNRLLDQARGDMSRLARQPEQARRAETLASLAARAPEIERRVRETASDTTSLVRVEPQVYELRMPPAAAAPAVALPSAKPNAAAPAIAMPPATVSPAVPAMATPAAIMSAAAAAAMSPANPPTVAPAALSGEPAPQAVVAVGAGAPPAQDEVRTTYTLEVSNGNGITGMARHVSKQLVERGLSRGRLTNQLPFREPVTLVQYRQGYEREASQVSQAFQAVFGEMPSTARSNTLRSDTHVRVLLGRDVIRIASPSKAKDASEMLARVGAPGAR